MHGVEMAAAHPGASDLFDLHFPAVRRAHANLAALIVTLNADPAARSGVGESPTDLAQALIYGMRGIREASTSVDEVRRLLAVQVRTLVRAVGAP